jgi:DUF4097 and DUF4098 domain-containing protein YvlB
LLSLSVEGGRVRLNQIHGEIEGELEGADLSADTVVGNIRLDADGGSVGLVDCRDGADLRLSESPLQMNATKGSIRVETDSEVRFAGHDGPLSIRGRGAAVNGGEAKGGDLEIETSGVEVRLDACEAATVIRGDDLDVHVTGSKGDLSVSTTYSAIVVEKPERSVTVENEFGNVEIRSAVQLVQVSNRDGDVRLDELKGPVKVKADGGEVSVSWTALGGQETSTVENERGDVRVDVPSNVRCLIDAEAPHGRIETDLAELRVSDDGHKARGVLLGGRGSAPYVKKPTIRVKSAGNLYVYANRPLTSERQGD